MDTHDAVHAGLRALMRQYADHPGVVEWITTHVLRDMPKLAEHKRLAIEAHLQKQREENEEVEPLLQVYLNKWPTSCAPTTGIYYDEVEFYPILNDTVAHRLNCTISHSFAGLKTSKVDALSKLHARIAQRSVLDVTPSTQTMQAVFRDLVPSVCPSKSAAKHLLAAVGDALLGKTPALVYVVPPLVFHWVQRMHRRAVRSMDNHALQDAFRENRSDDSDTSLLHVRLVRSVAAPDAAFSCSPNTLLHETLLQQSLAPLVVAAHHSQRFGNADAYLRQFADEDVRDHALQASTLASEARVFRLFDEEQGDVAGWAWADAHFVYKEFLLRRQWPEALIPEARVRAALAPDAPGQRPPRIVHPFQRFWESHFSRAPPPSYPRDGEWEIDELRQLYNTYSGNHPITDAEVSRVVSHYYGGDRASRFVYGVRCDLWDKHADVVAAMVDLWEQRRSNTSDRSLVDIQDVYLVYQLRCKARAQTLVASKQYVVECVAHHAARLLVHEGQFVEWASFVDLVNRLQAT